MKLNYFINCSEIKILVQWIKYHICCRQLVILIGTVIKLSPEHHITMRTFFKPEATFFCDLLVRDWFYGCVYWYIISRFGDPSLTEIPPKFLPSLKYLPLKLNSSPDLNTYSVFLVSDALTAGCLRDEHKEMFDNLLPSLNVKSPFMLYGGGLFGIIYLVSLVITISLRRRCVSITYTKQICPCGNMIVVSTEQF